MASRRTLRPAFLVTFAAASLVAGCSGTAGDDVAGGATEGGPDATGSDATGSPGPDAAATLDAAAEATPIDATMPDADAPQSDAGSEAAVVCPAGIGPGTPCSLPDGTVCPLQCTLLTCEAGVFVLTGVANPPPPPTASQPSGIYYDDLTLTLTSTSPGASFCYTLDGTSPVCSSGVCVGPARTYDAATAIVLDGMVTNPVTGTVTVNAVSCSSDPCVGQGVMPPQTYTLQVAPPSLQGPSPGAVLYTGAGVKPSLGTTTAGAAGRITADPSIGTNLSCTTGTSMGPLPQPFPVDDRLGMQTFWAIGCKPGYRPSLVTTASYAFALQPPSFTPPAALYFSSPGVFVDDTANAGAKGEYLCVRTDGTPAACGAPGACATGSASVAGGAKTAVTYAMNAAPPGAVDRTGAVLSAVACTGAAPTFTSSGTFTTPPYALRLDPVQFTPPSGTPVPPGGSLTVVSTAVLTFQ